MTLTFKRQWRTLLRLNIVLNLIRSTYWCLANWPDVLDQIKGLVT